MVKYPDMHNSLSLIPLGGVGDVTKNMYVYEMEDEILLIDCGLGFANDSMPGVDLLLPDISYLQSVNKKIVGMVITHGHEDHMGGLPFILPQLPNFPIYASPLTAALANEKLKEFGNPTKVQAISFAQKELTIGKFTISLIRVTHSVPDTAHILIKTPVGYFYHGSDFKFDLTPADGKKTDLLKIARTGELNVRCLLSDCLGSEREGHTPSEITLTENIEQEMRICEGKFIITTYSSNISRLNQAIEVAEKMGRQICFIGRSLIRAKEVAKNLGYLKIKAGIEVTPEQAKKIPDNKLMLLVAGSQGQQGSAMNRIAEDEHKDIKLRSKDVVLFSSDPIPGNEIAVNMLIDAIVKKGAKAVYSDSASKYHVSGHGAALELKLLMSLVKAKTVLPIGGTYRQMVVYKKLAKELGYEDKNILLLEDGQEMIFTNTSMHLGKKVPSRFVYVDEISGEEVESFILRDRKRISKEGIVIAMTQIDSETGNILETPDVIIRGFKVDSQAHAKLVEHITKDLKSNIGKRKTRIIDWIHIRKQISDIVEKQFFKQFKRRPLVLPIVVEV